MMFYALLRDARDQGFESTSLRRRVCCELGLCGRRDRVASTSRVARADHEIFLAASLASASNWFFHGATAIAFWEMTTDNKVRYF